MSKYDPRACGARCDECPLKGSTVVAPENVGNAGVVIVGEAPGQNEVKFGRPFVGPSGMKLEELLRKAGASRTEVSITNALLCRPETPDLAGKRRFEVKEYMAWIRRENMRLKKLKATPILSPFEACLPRLQFDLNAGEHYARERGWPNGAVIIPMGNFALSQIIGARKRATGIMKYRGSVIRVGEGA